MVFCYKNNQMKLPEENQTPEEQQNMPDPAEEVETVVSKNENMEPVPDQAQLDQKK